MQECRTAASESLTSNALPLFFRKSSSLRRPIDLRAGLTPTTAELAIHQSLGHTMGRWSHYDTDEERLPDGMRCVGYDADTQIYSFRDRDGNLWEGAPGARYGKMWQVQGPRRAATLQAENTGKNKKLPPLPREAFALPSPSKRLQDDAYENLMLAEEEKRGRSKGENGTEEMDEEDKCSRSTHQLKSDSATSEKPQRRGSIAMKGFMQR
jgi:hypothetical protein